MHTHEDVPLLASDLATEMMDSHQGSLQLEKWIESLSDYAWVFDQQFQLVRVDRRVFNRSGQQPEGMMGRSAWDTFPDLANTLWGHELRKTAEDSAPRSFEFFHPNWKLWLDCRVFVLRDQLILLANDTTPRKKTEAALQEAQRELETFSYSISHDMRAPLRAMQSFALILQQEWGKNLGAEGSDYLRRIVSASERLDRLIQDALAYSQLSRSDLALSPIDLAELLSGIRESHPEFQASQATISVTYPLPLVLGNATALTQCLANLIDNAIKFSKAERQPQIEIWAESQGRRTRIHIRDQGIGIDPAFHGKIFSMFYQHDPGSSGTGIGLVVVRKAAEKMNGTVGVDSELNKGSDFYLELDRAD